MAQDVSARTTHDLWVESRKMTLDISRPTATTIQLTITYPTEVEVLDGAVVTLGTKPITGSNYPQDGTQYAASLDFAAPADKIPDQVGANVVGFFSAILGAPLPGVVDPTTKTASFTLTITNTLPNQIYYASVHGSTNILQYYPIGVQSYPLEASRVEKDSSTYTGSIPTLPYAPVSPTVGQVYHDQQLNLVQYWTGTQWIPTRADSIVSGPQYPAQLGRVNFFSTHGLRVFDGSKWVPVTPTNFQVRSNTTAFVPIGQISNVTRRPDAPNTGDFIFNFTASRAEYWDGAAWVYPTSGNTLFLNPAPIPACVVPVQFDTDPPRDLYIGQLFYNTTTQTLDAWTGTAWIQANTDQAGTPTTDKIAIGTDGSYDERIRLIKILKSELGWPQSCVELKEEQFNIAIDNALDTYRQLSSGAYRMGYIMMPVLEGQQVYYLNNPATGTDRIVDVQQIHRLNVLGLSAQSGQDNIFLTGFLAQYYAANQVDILSIHLLHSLSEEFERMFAGNYTYLWNEASRELTITRRVARNEKIIIECSLERTEQEMLVDRWCKQFIQNWALAECKMYLGLIRSRFSSGTPGAAGTITQNGELLISEARQDMVELKQALLDYEHGSHIGLGNVSFLIG